MTKSKQILAVLTALLCLASAGCRKETGANIPDLESSVYDTEQGTAPRNSLAQSLPGVDDTEPELTKTDLDAEWDDSAVSVVFNETVVTPSASDGVNVENGVVTITKGGTYVFSGSLENGRAVINLDDKSEKVHLVFNGVSIRADQDAPLTILKADKAVITLADNTVNKISDSGSFSESGDDKTPNACISSKCDLTINGTGELTVTGRGNNGIHCKDDLKIVSGTVRVESENHGIRGNDTVLIHGGIVSVKSGGDGIKTSTSDQDGKGRIVMQGGEVTVVSAQDGLDAATDLLISGGNLDIESGGGAANGEQHRNNESGFRNKNPFSVEQQTTDDSQPSRKGIKAAQSINLQGGIITINSADDAVHADGSAGIGGKTVISVKSGDDGIHAEKQLCITDEASVTVSESYEGIEAYEIMITGGETRVRSSDDGMNASGPAENTTQADITDKNETEETQEVPQFGGRGRFGGMNANSTGILTISSGYLFVNSDGDGIDSNGDIEMTGGTVVVCGPTSDMNGPLDCGDMRNTIKVSGGTLMAVGSTGMMDVPQENYIAATDLNASAQTVIIVTDSEGKVLGALKTPKKAAGIIFSANGMKEGYQIYSGASYDGELNEDGFGSGGSCSGGKLVKSGSGGGGMGGFGSRINPFGDNRQQNPDDSSPFSGDDFPKMPDDGMFPDGEGGKPQRPDRKTDRQGIGQLSESGQNET